MNILQILPGAVWLCDERGDRSNRTLQFSLGQHLTLEFDLRGEAGSDGVLQPFDLATISDCVGYYFALADDWNAATAPLYLRNSGITFTSTETATHLSVELPNTGSAALVAALSGKASANFTAEIGGLDSDGLAVFVWQFKITVNNRIYLGSGAPESEGSEAAYLTAAEVRAMVSQLALDAGTGLIKSDNALFVDGNYIDQCISAFFVSALVDFRETTVYDRTTTQLSGMLVGGEYRIFTQPLTFVELDGVVENAFGLEATAVFTLATTATGGDLADLAPTISWVNSSPTLLPGKSYILSIKNNIGVAAEYTPATGA